MAAITSYAASEKGLLGAIASKIASVFNAIGDGFVLYMEQHSRFAEINRLSEMSDAELAERGLGRDDIVRHVFRDRFHY